MPGEATGLPPSAPALRRGPAGNRHLVSEAASCNHTTRRMSSSVCIHNETISLSPPPESVPVPADSHTPSHSLARARYPRSLPAAPQLRGVILEAGPRRGYRGPSRMRHASRAKSPSPLRGGVGVGVSSVHCRGERDEALAPNSRRDRSCLECCLVLPLCFSSRRLLPRSRAAARSNSRRPANRAACICRPAQRAPGVGGKGERRVG